LAQKMHQSFHCKLPKREGENRQVATVARNFILFLAQLSVDLG
jgi:hypothetical protein